MLPVPLHNLVLSVLAVISAEVLSLVLSWQFLACTHKAGNPLGQPKGDAKAALLLSVWKCEICASGCVPVSVLTRNLRVLFLRYRVTALVHSWSDHFNTLQ